MFYCIRPGKYLSLLPKAIFICETASQVVMQNIEKEIVRPCVYHIKNIKKQQSEGLTRKYLHNI